MKNYQKLVESLLTKIDNTPKTSDDSHYYNVIQSKYFHNIKPQLEELTTTDQNHDILDFYTKCLHQEQQMFSKYSNIENLLNIIHITNCKLVERLTNES